MRYPLELTLRPSRRILTLVCAIHLIAALASLLSALPMLFAAVLGALTLLSLGLSVRGMARNAARALVLRDDGLLEIGPGARPVRILPGSVDFGWAVWLAWRQDDGRQGALMLAPDGLPRGQWRALRIWLRQKALTDTAAPAPRDSGAA